MGKFKQFIGEDIVKYSSIEKTKEHINNVQNGIGTICTDLMNRGKNHDKSKLENPELEYFDKYTSILSKLEYGTDEYKKSLENLKPALDHHYKNNRHHPEFHKEGIDGMNLVDIIEMFCDWYSATKRTKNGDIHKSIDISAKRFNIDPQLVKILKNSVRLIDG